MRYDNGSNTNRLVLAPHGELIEPGTAEQALNLALSSPDTSCWVLLGNDAKATFDRWHIPSTSIAPPAFPLLNDMAGRTFETVISLHGLSDEKLLVGGRGPEEERERLAVALADEVPFPVEVNTDGPHGGVHKRNIVNRFAKHGGIQIEQGSVIRDKHRETIVGALRQFLIPQRREEDSNLQLLG